MPNAFTGGKMTSREWADKMCLAGLSLFFIALPFSTALMEIAFGVALCAWIAKLIIEKGEAIKNSRALPGWIFLLIFTILSAASIAWSESFMASFRGGFKVLEQVVLFLMCVDVLKSPSSLRIFEKIALISFTVIVANGFYQLAVGHDFIRHIPVAEASSGPRISSSLKSYGLYGSYLIVLIPWIASLASRYRQLRFLIIGLAVIGVGALLLTRSRGAVLAFFLSASALLILRNHFKQALIIGAVLIALVAVLPKSMIIHLDAENKEQSLVERYYLWRRAGDVIAAKPLTGTGINTYTTAHAKYDRVKNWRVRDYYAHNGYLQMAAETGIPALLSFLMFIGAYFIRSFKWMKTSDEGMMIAGALTGVLAFLLFACIDTVMHNGQAVLLFWLVLSLPFVYSQQKHGVLSTNEKSN